MARMLRCQFEGAIYHVMSRGVNRCRIFTSDADRLTFRNKLRESVETHDIKLYAYVLMPNHYHLLLMTPLGNLSRFMHQFGTSYTAYFNVRHRRCGALFGGRFKALLVEGDAYLLKLVRYLHLNPVQTKAMKEANLSARLDVLEKYPWSSHRSYGGWERRLEWISYAPLQALLGERMGTKNLPAAYRRYVQTGLAHNDQDLEEALKRSRKAVGSEAFCLDMEKQYQRLADEYGRGPDIAMRRMEQGIHPDRVLRAVAQSYGLDALSDWQKQKGNHEARDALIWLWTTESGLMGRDIGRRLGHKDGAVVSRRLRILRSLQGENLGLWKTCRRISQELSNVKA